jgi:hypothetical protein
MAHNSAVNLDIANLLVGFSIGGGTTKRTATFNGNGDFTLTNQFAGAGVYTYPNRAADTLIGFADYTAKGVILVGTGPSAFTPLAVGADTYVLTADSSQPSGTKWAPATGSGGVTAWTDVTGSSQAMVSGNGYYANNPTAVAFSLPSTAAKFDTMRIVGIQGAWSISQGAGQSILFGNIATTVGAGGSLASTDAGDCLELICIVANTTWRVDSAIGNISYV